MNPATPLRTSSRLIVILFFHTNQGIWNGVIEALVYISRGLRGWSIMYLHCFISTYSDPISFSVFILSRTTISYGHAMSHAVSCRFLTAESRLHIQVSRYGVCGGQRGTGTGFSPSPSVFPCQYHSAAAPYSLMHYLGVGQWVRLRMQCQRNSQPIASIPVTRNHIV
jgi:hypothetical protein